MSSEIHIPKLGMSMREATLSEWKFAEGDKVNTGDIVLIIETEKTKWDVEATASGLLHIISEVKAVEPVGQVVGLLAETEEELAQIQKDAPAPSPAKDASAPAKKGAAPAKKGKKGGRQKISPLAKKLAKEHGLDIASIDGTGPGGRIIKEDVLLAIENKDKAPAAGPDMGAPQGGDFEVMDGKRIKAALPLDGMRAAISNHMNKSLINTAQLTLMGEIDMSEIIKFRKELLKQEETLGTRITYTDIFTLAVTRALKDNPIVNASIIGDEVMIWEDVHMGIAVALAGEGYLGGGLIVPVIRNTDQKPLAQISKEAKVLIAKAREGRLMPDEVSGSTFTITNLGGMGASWGFGTPIINQPESAILGTGAISERAVVRDGEIVIRPVMSYSFTFDHRLIDGAPASVFMARLTELMENPLLLLC